VLAGRWTPTDYGDFAAAFALASTSIARPGPTRRAAWLPSSNDACKTVWRTRLILA
jgi:hypothetical protein